jgi:hypothetical protein
METQSQIASDLRLWFEEFGRALDAWEGWLARVEQAYVTGEYTRLQELESESAAIQTGLAEARESRSRLIQVASSHGFLGSSVTGMVRWLDHAGPSESKVRLKQLDQQLRRAQQMSTALWVTGFQAASYTSALLEILATGNAERATYGTCEREVLEGGHIVDAAA